MNLSVAAGEAGTAILSFTRDAAGNIDVSSIDRLPAGLDPAVSWLTAAFPDFAALGGALVTVDGAGLGQALWARLKVRRADGWRLYAKYGRDRQELVTGLLVALSEGRVHVAPSPHGEALRKAMLAYKKVVGDDGLIGGELILALALAALPVFVRKRRKAYGF
jgi:hypothetical protein